MNASKTSLSIIAIVHSRTHRFRRCLPVAIIGILAFCTISVHAATILGSDNFTLSSGLNVDSILDTQSSGVGSYTNILNTGGITVKTVSGFGSGNIMSTIDSTMYRAFNGGTTLTLNSLATGETLRLAFDLRLDGTTLTAQNYDFGFVNTASTNSIIYANVDLTGASSSEFYYRTGSANMSTSSAIQVGSSFSASAASVNTNYVFQLDVTKQAGGGFLIEYFRDGLSVGSTTQSSGSSFATNMGTVAITGIAFRQSTTSGVTSTLYDNVTVSVVPEPSTILLLSLGLLPLLAARCRRA